MVAFGQFQRARANSLTIQRMCFGSIVSCLATVTSVGTVIL
jgi:hypothetical protein